MINVLTTVAVSFVLASNAAVTTPADRNATKPKSEASERKYCITFEPSTESRISKTQCLTKSQWAEQGINVDEMRK